MKTAGPGHPPVGTTGTKKLFGIDSGKYAVQARLFFLYDDAVNRILPQ
jgi:hypothetical protein